jgi:P27 family predicted phage terminase small subunit
LLTALDVMPFAAYCDAVDRWRTASEVLATMAARDPTTNGLLIKSKAGEVVANPMVWVVSGAARAMLRYASEFGMTPAARTRINAGVFPPEPGPSKFDGLLGRYPDD